MTEVLNNYNKSVKAKPVFLTACLTDLMELGKEDGYHIVPHGSFSNDFDLLCVPWVDNPRPHRSLLDKIAQYFGTAEIQEGTIHIR